MIEHFLRRLAFNAWGKELVAAALSVAGEAPEASRLFAHIVTTESLYLARIRGEAPWPLNFWPDPDPERDRQSVAANTLGYESFLATPGEGGVTGTVSYRNSSGASWTSHVTDLLEQVLSHGVYHRGQINMLLRQHGHEPASVDYIVYCRTSE